MAITLENTKYTDIDLDFCKHYLRIDFDDIDVEINLYLQIAKSFVEEHSGKTPVELDNIHYSVICVLKLVSDFYNQKTSTVNGTNLRQDPMLEILMKNIRSYNLESVTL